MKRKSSYNTDTHDDTPKITYKKYTSAVISLLLSGININLAASLELWTKSCSLAPLLLFFLAGFVICFPLTAHFLAQTEKRLKIHSLLWGILMAAAYVLGCRMRRDGTALAEWSGLPVLLIQTACLSVFAAACISPFLQGFPWLRHRLHRHTGSGTCTEIRACTEIPSEGTGSASAARGTDTAIAKFCQPITGILRRKNRPAWQVWLLDSTVILLGWIPVFLAYYPSVFAYDAEGQLYQVLAHDYSTHHPLLHTIFLGIFFRLGGRLPGSYSAGMAVHSVVQMIIMACVFGYTLSFLYQRNVPAYLRAVLLLFYALFPANSILAMSTTKDVLFSALVLLHTISVYQLADNAENYPVEKWSLYLRWTVFMLLFRNNALYALIVSIPAASILLSRNTGKNRGIWRRYLLFTALAIILACAGNTALKATLHAHNGSPREMLSVPLQQMARTRVKAEETLPPDMRQELNQYLPEEWVFAAYNPYLADPVKNRAVIHDNPAGLIKTWIRLGLLHPQIYIDAFLDNSIGYWFLEDRTHAQIYGIGTESGFGYLSTDNRTMPAGFEIVEHSYLPGLRVFLEKIVSDNAYQKFPVLRVIFAPAFYWWLLCLYMAEAIYRRQYLLLLPAVFLVSYYLTLLLSPTVLIRYMYPFVVTVPVLCCCKKRA